MCQEPRKDTDSTGVAFLGRAVTRRAVPTALGPAALQKGSGCSTAARLTDDATFSTRAPGGYGGPGVVMGVLSGTVRSVRSQG